MSLRHWMAAPCDKDLAAQIAEECNIDAFLALLLVARGKKTAEEAADFLNPEEALCDPFLLPDMHAAVNRIQTAIDGFERIAVYGDFDADGITSTALLYTYLEAMGADVMYRIPERAGEGYGLHKESIDQLAENGVRLIVTVDNGISALEEAEYIREKGMDLVITDHHKPGETLPRAVAVVDPHRQDCDLPFYEWAGVGVAFKLVCALHGGAEEMLEAFADLVALGTVADVVPLCGENRALVRTGLAQINRSPRLGIQALREASGVDQKTVTASTLSFSLVPRINASGRMGSAQRAVRLLLSEEEEDARYLADVICNENRLRQETEQEILLQAQNLLLEHPEWLRDRVLVVNGSGWHEGVIGIVAARLCERYGKPCVVLTQLEGEKEARGSCRSIEGFSVFEALSACADCLIRFGGHAMAAGMRVEGAQIQAFREKINQWARERFPQMPPVPLRLDCKLSPAHLSLELLSALDCLEPFGAGNPQPLFELARMNLVQITPVGKGKHLRLKFRRGNTVLEAMRFGTTPESFPYQAGDLLDLAVRLERNEYNNVVSVSLQAVDLRLSGLDESRFFTEKAAYEQYLRGEPLTKEFFELLLPGREDFAETYRFLRQAKIWPYGLEQLYFRLQGKGIGFGKLQVAVEVFKERGLIHEEGQGVLCVTPDAPKVDLNASPVLGRLVQSRKGA